MSLRLAFSATLLLCVTAGTVSASQRANNLPGGAAITAAERSALISLYESTGGAHWAHRRGWLGPRGTECGWYGVACESSGNGVTVGSLDLAENNLVGAIPQELGHLSALRWLSVGENHLTGPIPGSLARLKDLERLDLAGNDFSGMVPAQLIRKWLAGQLDIAAEARLLTTVSAIDYEWNASSLLCARRRFILRADGSVVAYTERCRNTSLSDRSTYCEEKEGWVIPQEFAKLALLIEQEGFFEISPEFSRSVTEGTFESTRVTSGGKSHAVTSYGGAGPFKLWIVERAIESVATSAEWKKTTTRQKCPHW